MHYLMVDPLRPLILHHARTAGATALTHIVTEGTISLDPPGLTLAVTDIYGDMGA